MKHILAALIVLSSASFVALSAQAGDDRLKEVAELVKKDKMGWTAGAGIGLDLAGMGLINPRIGAGNPRIGVGGLGTFFANRKEENWFWDNQLSLQLSAQRLGRTSPAQPFGFQKNLDIFRLNSRYGRKISGDKWFVAANVFAQTLLLETYASNFLKPIGDDDRVVARFISPLQVNVSPGIDYKPNANWSFFYSPVSIQWIYVADDAIAATGVHGNEVTRRDDGSISDFKNRFLGLGSELKAAYNNKYWDDRLTVTSGLRLFSNYLKEPQNVDVLFTNNFSIQIFKGLSLDLLAEYFYDHDVLVKKDINGDGIYEVTINPDGSTSGPDRLGRGAQMTGAFLLKYNLLF
ncbi:MAG: DUF3078 domain-containing protein [Saprospiraceae bacterium]